MSSIYKHSKKIVVTALTFSSAVVFFAFQNCSKVAFVSVNEQAALKQNPFSFGFDANGKVDGVLGSDGLPIENLYTNLSALSAQQIQFTTLRSMAKPMKTDF